MQKGLREMRGGRKKERKKGKKEWGKEAAACEFWEEGGGKSMMQKLHKCPSLNEFEREWAKNLTFMFGLKMGSLVLSLIGLYPMTHNIRNGHILPH